MNKIFNKKGFLVVEILAAIAVITVVLSTLFGLAIISLKNSNLLKERSQANSMTQEAMEAIRNFRDGTTWSANGLGTFATNTDYYFQATGTPAQWQFLQGAQSIGIFNSNIIFTNVSRDANGNIVQSGGTNDPDTKKAQVTVSWKNYSIILTGYFTNWR